MYKFEIRGQAPSKKNTHESKWSYKHKRFVIAPAKKYMYWENAAVLQLKSQKKNGVDYPVTGKLHVKIMIYRRHNYKPDLSNLIQSVEDALEKAGIIENDNQIESLDGSRRILGVSEGVQRAEIEIRKFME